MHKRERAIEARLVEEAEKLGLLCVKFDPGNMAGMPDRLLVLPGARVIWVEIKADRGVLSDLQMLRHVQLQAMGHEVAILRGPAQVREFIADLKQRLKAE